MAAPDTSALTLPSAHPESSQPEVMLQAADTPSTLLPHRSHDPNNNLKRSDPFQFGSRYLLPDDNPYEFNAWDHVEPSAEDLARFESQLVAQRAAPVSDFDRNRFNGDPAKWWNRFYANNTSNFFKDRKWLQQEFPILKDVTRKGAGKKVLLEVGAGAGNTCFPILKENENEDLMIYACDFSPKAIDLIRGSAAYDPDHLQADVWDVASSTVPPGLEEGMVDVVIMVFIFSALQPTQWEHAVRNIWKLLKPGGEVCFRDYGRGDLAQVRLKKGRWMEENFYIRGDGTRVYFFDKDELRNIWSGEALKPNSLTSQENSGQAKDNEDSGIAVSRATDGADGEDRCSEVGKRISSSKGRIETLFEIESLGVDRRLLINRQKQLKMYRCWMQGRFRKPGTRDGVP
ncbi:MAG: hypothetical protein LQ346_004358 [Caloplaca aetnensis]|nr:MAG: hypothetical protein LQ346_004358 [Caloplaca aetnensis]